MSTVLLARATLLPLVLSKLGPNDQQHSETLGESFWRYTRVHRRLVRPCSEGASLNQRYCVPVRVFEAALFCAARASTLPISQVRGRLDISRLRERSNHTGEELQGQGGGEGGRGNARHARQTLSSLLGVSALR